MLLIDLKTKLNPDLYNVLEGEGINELRPCQIKAIDRGVLDNKSLLVCTPTASGKTLVAEFAGMQSILNKIGKAIYIVPLKALANEKYKEFKRKYGHLCKITISIGDLDKAEPYLQDYDLIITTSEKLDSLLRHHSPWIKDVNTIIVDEIHLLNDVTRGPTLEIIITMLKRLLKNIQIIGLSATIGNPRELAEWLEAELILDSWRPVELKHGIYLEGQINFY